MATNISSDRGVTDSRIAQRHEFDTRIRICLHRDGLELKLRGWVRDMSESGLRAFVAQNLFLGELVTIYLPLGEADKLSLLAKVIRKTGTEHGFQFTSLSEEQRLRIRVALQQENTLPQFKTQARTEDAKCWK